MQRTAPTAHALCYIQCIMHIHANKKPVINPRYSLFHSHLPGFNHLSEVYMLHAVMWKSALLAIVCVCSFSRVVTLASFCLSSFWECFFSIVLLHSLLPAVKYLHKIHFFWLFYSSLVAGLCWTLSSVVWIFISLLPSLAYSFFCFFYAENWLQSVKMCLENMKLFWYKETEPNIKMCMIPILMRYKCSIPLFVDFFSFFFFFHIFGSHFFFVCRKTFERLHPFRAPYVQVETYS